jgi:uncharacterized protein Yka (UPF0111/DUF47 family)
MFKLQILPSGDKFLTYLSQMAQKADKCGHHLKAYIVATDDKGRKAAANSILESRARAKTLMAEITRELSRSFVTPFDREDIQDFAMELYKIPKIIEKVQNRIELHGIKDEHGDFHKQIDLIVQEADAMEEMVKNLVEGNNKRKVQDQVSFMYDLEHRADGILSELLGELFNSDRSPRDLILRKDIYDMLEKVIDRYRNAAGIALQIVLKHG